MEDGVKIEAFSKDGLIETIEMDSYEYYDGDTYDDFIETANIVSKGIKYIKLIENNSQGKPYKIYIIYFNENGSMGRNEVLLDEDYS